MAAINRESSCSGQPNEKAVQKVINHLVGQYPHVLINA